MIFTTWIKRAADFLEKLAVGALVIGFFQGDTKALAYGVVFILTSFLLTERK